MICVFDATNTNFTGNGNAVLMPTACSHRQEAAGKYDLTMTHPVDKTGKWTHLVPEAVIRAPVPEETIETAFSGLDADVYATTAKAEMREGPHEPTNINYTAWVGSFSQPTYSVGDKVSVEGWSHRNYQCVYFDANDQARYVPPYNSSWWKEIADQTSGDPLMATLKAGTEVYFVEDAGSGWYKVCTMFGMEGYVRSNKLSYVKHVTPAETAPRVITEQLFRIKKVTRSTDGMSVNVTAEHVSYDMSGVLVESAKIGGKPCAEALMWIEQGTMMDYQGTIATDMTSSDDGTYTGEIKGKNLTFALLDPDRGVVGSFGAMYRRDNWDVFVLKKTDTDRGFRLRYRKNMRGVNWNMGSDRLATRVVPVAKDADGNDLYLDDDGVKWVDSPIIGNYPVIRMERIKVDGQVGKDDGTETGTEWTEEALRDHMREEAMKRFTVDKADALVHEITVDFEMLGDTADHPELKGLERVLMYDTIPCINEEIGLSVTAEVTEIEFNCIRKKITALKLSNVNAYGGRNVGGFNLFANSITADKLTDEVTDELGTGTLRDANQYTDTKTKNLNTALRNWVTANFEPIT